VSAKIGFVKERDSNLKNSKGNQEARRKNGKSSKFNYK
jgi:hypothetical protein